MAKVEIHNGVSPRSADIFSQLAKTAIGDDDYESAIVQMAMNILALRQYQDGIDAADFTKRHVRKIIERNTSTQH